VGESHSPVGVQTSEAFSLPHRHRSSGSGKPRVGLATAGVWGQEELLQLPGLLTPFNLYLPQLKNRSSTASPSRLEQKRQIQVADEEYKSAFYSELEAFKERIKKRAAEKIAEAMEEERLANLGPGGLDPADVFESLPR